MGALAKPWRGGAGRGGAGRGELGRLLLVESHLLSYLPFVSTGLGNLFAPTLWSANLEGGRRAFKKINSKIISVTLKSC